jgi:hypothetical protein
MNRPSGAICWIRSNSSRFAVSTQSRSWSGPSRPSVRRKNVATGSGRAGDARKLTRSLFLPSKRPAFCRVSSRTDASSGGEPSVLAGPPRAWSRALYFVLGTTRATVMSASPSHLCAESGNLPNVRQHDGMRGLHQISSAAGPHRADEKLACSRLSFPPLTAL